MVVIKDTIIKQNKEGFYFIRVPKELNAAIEKLLVDLSNKEASLGNHLSLKTTIELPKVSKTYSQVKTVHMLVRIIWQCENEYILKEQPEPSVVEHEQLYEDLKLVYAPMRPSSLNKDVLVPIGLSQMTTNQAARFIDALLNHVADIIGKPMSINDALDDLFKALEEHKGAMDKDTADYYDEECLAELKQADWRLSHPVSQASGRGGVLHLHHIVSRGASVTTIDNSWNWCMLTHDEHKMLHDEGTHQFIKKYPHLKNRFKRAETLAKHKGVL